MRYLITVTTPQGKATTHHKRCNPEQIVDIAFDLPGVTPLTKVTWHPVTSLTVVPTPEDLADLAITRANERAEQRAEYRRELREERA